MGMVLGLGGLGGGVVEQPPYEVVETREGYTVRHYPPMIMAVAQADVSPDALDSKDSALFSLLAGYIGVRGAPRNAQGRSVAMTAPVLTHVEGSGPAGLSRRKSMAFILPRRFSRPEQAPAPTSSSVLIFAVPARTIAVQRFSGTRFCGMHTLFFCLVCAERDARKLTTLARHQRSDRRGIHGRQPSPRGSPNEPTTHRRVRGSPLL